MTIDKVHLASRASELLDDPLLESAFVKIERDAIEATLNEQATDDDRRRSAMRANVVREVRDNLRLVISNAAEKPEGIKLP